MARLEKCHADACGISQLVENHDWSGALMSGLASNESFAPRGSTGLNDAHPVAGDVGVVHDSHLGKDQGKAKVAADFGAEVSIFGRVSRATIHLIQRRSVVALPGFKPNRDFR